VRLLPALGWAQHAIAGLIPNPIALGHPKLILVLVLAGMGALLRKQWPVAALFVVVAAAALVAATLHLYPLRLRLALYLVPLVLIALVAALDLAPLVTGRAGRAVGAAGLALIALVGWKPLHEAEHTARHPTTVTEMRPLLEHVKRNLLPGDIVFVHWAATAEFEYYQSVLDLPPYGSFSWFPGPLPCDDTAALTTFSQIRRAWVVFGSPPVFDKNDTNALSLQHFDRAGHRVEDRKAPGKAEVALYDNLHAPPPETPAPPSPHESLCLHLIVP
jgi:hypothetical protein